MNDWARKIEEMKRSVDDNYEYQRGYSDGFKEGCNKALEQYMEHIQIAMKPPVIVIQGSELLKGISK